MKKLIIPLIVAILGGLIVYFITQHLSKEELSVTVDSQAIHVTNNTDQTLMVRVRFANKTESGFSYGGHTDKTILAKQTISYPFPSFDFEWYEIRVWDSDNNFLFEKVRKR